MTKKRTTKRQPRKLVMNYDERDLGGLCLALEPNNGRIREDVKPGECPVFMTAHDIDGSIVELFLGYDDIRALVSYLNSMIA